MSASEWVEAGARVLVCVWLACGLAGCGKAPAQEASVLGSHSETGPMDRWALGEPRSGQSWPEVQCLGNPWPDLPPAEYAEGEPVNEYAAHPIDDALFLGRWLFLVGPAETTEAVLVSLDESAAYGQAENDLWSAGGLGRDQILAPLPYPPFCVRILLGPGYEPDDCGLEVHAKSLDRLEVLCPIESGKPEVRFEAATAELHDLVSSVIVFQPPLTIQQWGALDGPDDTGGLDDSKGTLPVGDLFVLGPGEAPLSGSVHPETALEYGCVLGWRTDASPRAPGTFEPAVLVSETWFAPTEVAYWERGLGRRAGLGLVRVWFHDAPEQVEVLFRPTIAADRTEVCAAHTPVGRTGAYLVAVLAGTGTEWTDVRFELMGTGGHQTVLTLPLSELPIKPLGEWGVVPSPDYAPPPVPSYMGVTPEGQISFVDALGNVYLSSVIPELAELVKAE